MRTNLKHELALKYEFVRNIPENLEEKTLYVSMDYATVVHKCCCGCGQEVVTPLGPTDWELTYNGEGISLYPSIGNWSFKCQSHYWIEKSIVKWAPRWSKKQIAAGRMRDRQIKSRYYSFPDADAVDTVEYLLGKLSRGFWSWLSKLWSK